MNRRRRNSLAGSPLLIGAVTTLIVVVAVFLSYNADNGLPFVPTYDIKVELPEASGLLKSNQVRIAGTRVGIVTGLTPKQNPRTGAITAVAELQLEKKVQPLPADTRAIVQSVSAVGLKYLELEKGSSHRTLSAGKTIPVSQTSEPVDIDELFNMFDKPTREAIKINTNNFGDGLAARGAGLNNTIAEFRPLVTNAVPVLHNLASPQTDLRGLWIALERVAGQSAPVAEQQANYYVYLDTFFTAFASVARYLEAATAGGPASLEQAIYSLPHQAKADRKFDRVHAPASPERSRPRRRSPPNRGRIQGGRGQPAEPPRRSTPPAGQVRRGPWRHSGRTRSSTWRSKTSRRRSRSATRCSPGSPRCRPSATTSRSPSATSRASRSENVGVGSVARAGLRALAERPQQRGLPVLSRRPTARRSTTPSHSSNDHRKQPRAREPLPVRLRPRSAAGLRSRQRGVHQRGRPSSATCPPPRF